MPIETYLEEGVTIVAATERLARDLRVRSTLERREQGHRVWAAPPIHSFRAWAERTWTATWPQQQVLFPAQELALWLFAVEKSGQGEDLISKTAAARQARLTGNLAARYGIDPNPGAFGTQDEQAFFAWSGIVRSTLQDKGWITEEQIPGELCRLLDEGLPIVDRDLLLVGFLDETKAQTGLFEKLSASGVRIRRLDTLEPIPASVISSRPTTRLAQYREVACGIRTLLAQAGTNARGEPPRIGILVPALSDSRAEITAVLTEYVSPHSVVPGAARARVPWRFSKGSPLAEHPLVASALDILSLDAYRNTLQLLSRVSMSPHTFGDFRSTDKAEFDLKLRKRGGTRFSFRSVQAICRKNRENADRLFPARLDGWLEAYVRTQPGTALPSVWADWIESVLAAADWARRDLTAEESQAHDDWQECLDVLRAMDVQVREINKARMIAWMREIALGRTFQPNADFLQPIQVLEYWEAIGMQFDHLFVLDLTANAMPEQTRTNGFIPGDRLAAAGVPNATPESSLARGQRWYEQVCQMAAQVTLIAPKFEDSGAALIPSPLHANWSDQSDGAAQCQSHLQGILAKGVQTQAPQGESVPPVVDAVAEGLSGGVSILKSAAVSPWVAFVRHRLGLKAFPDTVDGIEAAVQGDLVHRALERIWQVLRTQTALKATPPTELRTLVADEVRKSQDEDQILSAAAYGAGLAAVERQRAVELILDWLALEATRVLPFEVMVCEGRAEAAISGLPLSLRIDRIDRLEMPDGSFRYLVLDYKSSASLTSATWEPDSMSEPQLPVYATFATLSRLGIPRVDGVGFAKVAEGACDFALASNFADTLVPDSRGTVGVGSEQWQETLEAWRKALLASAQSFLSGDLTLDRERFRRSTFDRDLDPLVRPRTEPKKLAATEDPF